MDGVVNVGTKVDDNKAPSLGAYFILILYQHWHQLHQSHLYIWLHLTLKHKEKSSWISASSIKED
jgi:hypothetical protein